MGDKPEDVGNQRHDADRSPARPALGAIGDHEHDKRQQGCGGDRSIEQQRGECGGDEREQRRQGDGDQPLLSRTVAHVGGDEQCNGEAENAIGDRQRNDLAQQQDEKERQHTGECRAQRGIQTQRPRVRRKQQSNGQHPTNRLSVLPTWL